MTEDRYQEIFASLVREARRYKSIHCQLCANARIRRLAKIVSEHEGIPYSEAYEAVEKYVNK